MPRPVPVPIRTLIWQRSQRGQSAAAIAQDLSLPPRTVRHLVQQFHRRGEDALLPRYAPPTGATDAAREAALQAALALRRPHPRWGAPLIRSLVLRDHPAAALPAVRTLQRLFRRHGLARPPRSELPPAPRQRAVRPHEVWQMDASEAIRLATGQEVSWLRIVDEFTGAVLLTRVFSLGALVPRPGRRDRRDAARGLRAVGAAGSDPGRQRPPVGLDRRPADGAGPVAAGTGR